jgi:predicted amidohydrolase YtcJ
MQLFAVLFATLFSVAIFAHSASNRSASRIWIADVTIISPENLDHIGTGSVLIENGRIVRVDRRVGSKKPAGATLVSGRGSFLIPGLIDSHVHLASIPGMSWEVSFGPAENKPAMIKRYLEQLPRSYLYFGYTTLVDLAVMDHRVLDDFRQAPLHPISTTAGGPCHSRMGTRCRSRR